MRRVAERSRVARKPASLFVNNRPEGNAPGAIEAAVAGLA
jgi:hypothetical protein